MIYIKFFKLSFFPTLDRNFEKRFKNNDFISRSPVLIGKGLRYIKSKYRTRINDLDINLRLKLTKIQPDLEKLSILILLFEDDFYLYIMTSINS